MFEQYEELAKEQYPEFKFDSWEIQSVMKTIQGFEEGSYQLVRKTLLFRALTQA